MLSKLEQFDHFNWDRFHSPRSAEAPEAAVHRVYPEKRRPHCELHPEIPSAVREQVTINIYCNNTILQGICRKLTPMRSPCSSLMCVCWAQLRLGLLSHRNSPNHLLRPSISIILNFYNFLTHIRSHLLIRVALFLLLFRYIIFFYSEVRAAVLHADSRRDATMKTEKTNCSRRW